MTRREVTLASEGNRSRVSRSATISTPCSSPRPRTSATLGCSPSASRSAAVRRSPVAAARSISRSRAMISRTLSAAAQAAGCAAKVWNITLMSVSPIGAAMASVANTPVSGA